jgi:hypothetical protein
VRTTHDAEKLFARSGVCLRPTMDERQRWLWAGAEARVFGFAASPR